MTIPIGGREQSMKDAHWSKIEQLFHEARELQGNDRARFLDEACGADAATRHEVERLLQQNAGLAIFLNEPAVKLMESGTEVPSADPGDLPTLIDEALPSWPKQRSLAVGQTLGSYRLTRQIGQGGFGQVWEAESLITQRRLALKVLTPARQIPLELLERFENEAKLAASINHPRCVFVFGAEQIEDRPVITMELMAGGTLQDRLDNCGSIPVMQAVDMILDIIEGLEVAQSVGILHCDIKPSNCFLDQFGRCKIGDFGLSRTLETADVLTPTGIFIGTPCFASTEQIRGRSLDIRSDIYSVGATLYALVTGRVPFRGKNAAEVLARALTELPIPVSEEHPEIPKKLDSVIQRAMSKDPRKRFQTYPKLRDALLPFSSRGVTPSSLGKRILANQIDTWVVLFPVVFVLYLYLASTLQTVVSFLFVLGYFVLTEKPHGFSLGKRIMGLRVTTLDGSPLTYRQVLLRTFIYVTPSIPLSRLPLYTPSLFLSLLDLTRFAIFLTIRPGNGYAGLHELLSKTRVRSIRAREAIALPTASLPRVVSPEKAGEYYGPYCILGTVWKREFEALYVAEDQLLDRKIWIHEILANRSIPADVLADVRPERVQWLQRGGTENTIWDAYEVPLGMDFCDWVRKSTGLSWSETRTILVAIAKEFDALLYWKPEMLRLNLHHIWVDSYGQARLLNFPARDDSVDQFTLREWSSFIHETAFFALKGVRRGRSDAIPNVPVPEYARTAIRHICGKDGGLRDPRSLVTELEAIAEKPARVTWARRVALTLTMIVPALIPIVVWGSFSPTMFPVVAHALRNVGYRPDVWKIKVVRDTTNNPFDFRVESVFQGVIDADERLWAYYYEHLRNDRQAYLKSTPRFRRFLESSSSRFPNVSDAQAAEARRIFTSGEGVPSDLDVPIIALLLLARYLGFCSLVLTPILGTPPLFALYGIVIQTTTGERAGRLLCTLRSSIAWAPFIGVWINFDNWRGYGWTVYHVGLGEMVFAISLLAVGYSMLNPSRGIADLIAGTHLVPR
jgi:eukaryotic-like serine/threonine-protein kinase